MRHTSGRQVQTEGGMLVPPVQETVTQLEDWQSLAAQHLGGFSRLTCKTNILVVEDWGVGKRSSTLHGGRIYLK